MAEKKLDTDNVIDSLPGLREAINDAVKRGVTQAVQAQNAERMANEPKSMAAQPYHPGAFRHDKLTDSLEEVYCENCGSFERRPIPVVEKVEYKDHIPDSYMKKPETTADLLKIIDAGHADGTPWYKCPTCTKAILDWEHANADTFKGMGISISDIPPKKK
jgi:hypothetical protein